MFDIIIKNGTIVDGTGAPPVTGDVAITDGTIVEVGPSVSGSARRTIDADGALVTPGWVDVHTHYDGQVSWDTEIAPSSHNGVTTVVMGNCGVGFAPVAPGAERELIELMEGVEDIPGSALHEGMEWGEWESFPDYLDYLAGREYALDIGAQIAHGAVRFYAMGERGRVNEDATADDVAEMSRLVGEAIEAGAVGFSTSRTIGHRALWGEPVPGTFAADEELLAIAAEMGRVGKGVFEMIPAGTVGKLENLGGERTTQQAEHDLMRRFGEISGRPVTFTLVQSPDYEPDLWREILELTDHANAAGARLHPQVSSRPIGFLTGLSAYHAFMRKPTYLQRLADLPLAERARAMADPDIKAALLAESDIRPDAPGSMENVAGLFRRSAAVMYPLSDPVDYEPGLDDMLGAHARAEGRDPLEYLYDFLIADGGTRFASLSTVDVEARMNVLREMLEHPATVTGLSDAGAHVTLICDGTMPTTQLTYWARDRRKGEQLPLEFLVHKQTARNAALYGFDDRGTIAVGKRADVNVIDHDALTVAAPVAHHDLPAGGTRLMQPVSGYVATICNGTVTRDHDTDTGERPGRLVRS
ncbi:MAG: N-acyl-D-amino-acid deacylase family protein [Ilumatobacter sp.]|uniref:N-acyl-D-amino-acid deacylase family protein n=1 Tax=Ilumatobacter sp. TaxID=1967498 RepID=UPI00391CF18F